MSAVKILPAEENHLDEVNQFLIKHFFSREPLGLRLGISPAKDTQEWISQVTLPLLNQNVSSIENTTGFFDRKSYICKIRILTFFVKVIRQM